jgi:signal transduction histidine kinase
MRRRFFGRFLVFVALVVVVVAGLSALVGRLAFGPDGPRGPFVPLGLLLLLVLVVVAVRAGRRFAGPLADVMEAADRVAAGDYATRVDERGPGDVRRLSHAFNEMTARLGSNEERRRRLLSDVAHELRTPLSVIQANLEAILDGLYPPDQEHLGRVLEETKVMSRLLEDLQTLSTAEAGVLRLHRQRMEPRDLAAGAVEAFAAQADEAGVSLRAHVADAVPVVDVDPIRIGEVLANLLSNALRHTRRRPSRTGPSASACGTPVRASPPSSSRTSSTASRGRRTRRAPASGSRSRRGSSRPTAGRSTPRAGPLGRRSPSSSRARSGTRAARGAPRFARPLPGYGPCRG